MLAGFAHWSGGLRPSWKSAACAALLCVPLCGPAVAAERKAYKYVDEKGNVVYSQTPPADGKEAKKVDISPAHRGQGGYSGREPYVSPDSYSTYDRRQELLDERKRRQEEGLRRREELRQKRLAQMEEECIRNRGTDCKNPATLRYQESQNIPRPLYPRARQ